MCPCRFASLRSARSTQFHSSSASATSSTTYTWVGEEVASHRRRTALDADGVREAVREARSVAGELEDLIRRLEHAPADGHPPR
jgi:hypothetical protein